MAREDELKKRIEEYCKNTMNIQEDVLRLRIENERLQKELLEVRQQLDTTEREWGKDTTKLIHFKTQLIKAKEYLKQILPYLEYTDEESEKLYDKIKEFIKD